MRLLLAFDSFKGSLSSAEIARVVADAALRIWPDIQFNTIQLADGGEGSLQAFQQALGGTIKTSPAADALQRPCQSDYLALPDGSIIMECASSVGLAQLKQAERNPEQTSSYGLGLQLRYLVEAGYTKFQISLGGSACSDGGLGMLAALGATLYNRNNQKLSPDQARGSGMQTLSHIDLTTIAVPYKRLEIKTLVDVQNPLLGPEGAAAIFGPQKGADQTMVTRLQVGLENMARCMRAATGIQLDPGSMPGGGAAGGLGMCLAVLSGRALHSGFNTLAQAYGLKNLLYDMDLVLTGEGALDSQSLAGKGPLALAALCQDAEVPCIALCGQVDLEQSIYRAAGLTAAFSISPGPIALELSMQADFTRKALASLTEAVLNSIQQFT